MEEKNYANMDMNGGGIFSQFNAMDFNLNLANNQSITQHPSQAHNEENINYYQEACKLYIANVVLTTQMKELVAEKNELLAKIAALEKKGVDDEGNSTNNVYEDKKKRHRRTAKDIDRHYQCPINSCGKSYGSEGSLTQHVKLKHPDQLSQLQMGESFIKKMNDNDSEYSEDKSGREIKTAKSKESFSSGVKNEIQK